MENSAFTFIGTVLATQASTMPPISPSDSIFVVSIDDTIIVPAALGNQMHQDITLLSGHGTANLAPGQRFFFFVIGRLFGPSMAAQEICRLPVDQDSLTIRQQIAQIRSDIADDKLMQRLKPAETVVLGRITRTAPFSGGTPQPSIGSEHNPDWWEVQVQVISTEKGLSQSSVRALFPHSRDSAWFQAPKLAAGPDSIILILDRAHIKEFDTDELTVTDPLDVQPPRELNRIRDLLRKLRIR